MIGFFLKRRVVINLMSLFFIVFGGYLFLTVRREAFPEFTFDIVTITTINPGASPKEVEKFITRPIEEAVRAVDGIDKVESYSLENRSLLVIHLDEDLTDGQVSKAVLDIQQEVGRISDLPEEAEDPVVFEMTSDRPLITIAVAGGDGKTRDDFAEDLKEAIEDIPGVSKVDGVGDRPREIWVEAPMSSLRRHRITLTEIAAAIRKRNLNLSAGGLEIGTKELLVRTEGMLDTAGDVAGVILRGNDERSFLRVRDVARVRETFEDEDLLTTADSLPAILLQVYKHKRGDSIHLVDSVLKIKKRYEPKAGKLGLKLTKSDDMSFFIRRRLKVMRNNMIMGGCLVLVVLFLILEWRVAMVAALGIPLAFIGAMAAAIPAGFTLNLISMMALIIVLGLLNDDAVVVSENIYRHLEEGKSPSEAAEQGTREVLLPVTAAVGTSMAAFVPFALVSGIMGKFLFIIPVTVVICLAASLLEAFFILPSHAVDLLSFRRRKKRSVSARYQRMLGGYRRLLVWAIDHRYKFLVISVIFTVFTAGAVWLRVKLVLFPEGMIDQVFVQVETPRGSSLETTRKVFGKVEKEILKLPPTELDTVSGTVGMTGFEETIRRGTHLAQARVFLVPQEYREKKTEAILAELRPRLEKIPGIAKITVTKLRHGPPVGRAVQVRIRGRDLDTLEEISGQMKSELRSMPGVFDIRDSMEGGKEELRVSVLPEEAAYAGLDVTRVAGELLFAVDGREVTKIRRDREEVKVRVRLADGNKHLAAIRDLRVLNALGRQVRIGSVIRLERRPGPAYIEHYNYRRSLTVLADVDNVRATSSQVNSAIAGKFKHVPEKYPGYELIFGGEEENTRESMKSLRRALVVALILDFVLLAGLFNSYVRPLLIMITIPIGILGVAWALIFHGEPASFMALLGTVALTGVVVNNAVLLISFANSALARGKSLRDAVIEAGMLRFRPIWASSLTTLAALFPTAYGLGGREPFVQPMSLALAWGLAFATPLTLLLIPVFCVILDDITGCLRRGQRTVESQGEHEY